MTTLHLSVVTNADHFGGNHDIAIESCQIDGGMPDAYDSLSWAAGSRMGVHLNRVTSGRVSSLKRDARGAPVIQTDAAASCGNSGGPAIDERGEVVGILTFISVTADESQSVQGFNFLVPANAVREFAHSAGVKSDATARSAPSGTTR